MRWMIMLCLLAGCAASPEPRAQWESAPEWLFDAESVTYESPELLPSGDREVVAALTLVDLDAGAAAKLLGIEEPNDIAPRAVTKPAGEMAALLADSFDAGELIFRGSIWFQPGQVMPVKLIRECVYLKHAETEVSGGITVKTILSSYSVGASGSLLISPSRLGGWSIEADLHSLHLLASDSFTTGLGVNASIPTVTQTHRVAVESVASGETGVFQLSRAENEEGSRIMLLFVRIAGGE